MSWVVSIGVAVISAVVGLLLAGVVANACVSWYRIPSREGASGYFVIFTALGGGVAAFLIGLVTARFVATSYGGGYLKQLGSAIALLMAFAVGSALISRLLANVPPPQKESPPAPQKTRGEVLAEQSAGEEAEFAALADAPIKLLFPYLHKDAQKQRALANILARPNLRNELKELVLSEDADAASEALGFIANLPNPALEFVPVVEEAGRDVADRIRTVNNTPAEADPSYTGAADVSVRFHGWMAAVRTLRTTLGTDFTPELKTILELSRVRRDSHVMRSDVCRVTSFYLHEWAGIPPLPDDPKPR